MSLPVYLEFRRDMATPAPAGSWLSVKFGRMLLSSTTLNSSNTKSLGMPKNLAGAVVLLPTSSLAPISARDAAITRLVEDADLVLMLGVIVSDTNFALSNQAPDPRRTILSSSREVQIGHDCFRDMPLADLIEGLEARATPSASLPHQLKQRPVYPRGLPGDDAPRPPVRPLILVGDGAFQMTGWEIGNCRRYGFDPIVVLFNNRSWEMQWVFQRNRAPTISMTGI